MPTAKSYIFDLNGVPVHVTRRRTSHLTLRVLPNRGISLSAPLSTSKRSLADFLYSHEQQVIDLLKDYAHHHDPALFDLQRAFAHLEPHDEILWWGKPFSVAWDRLPSALPHSAAAEKPLSSHSKDPSKSGVCVDRSKQQVVFWGQAAKKGSSAETLRQKLVRTELSKELERATLQLLPQVESALGVTVASVSYRAMTSRWGSCRFEKGRITLNLDLATHDPTALEMVLWHEACHLRVPHHGREFQELLGSVYPQWNAVSDQLDYEGMRLSKSIAN